MIKICWIGNAILMGILIMMLCFKPLPKIKGMPNLNYLCYWPLNIIFNVVMVYKVHRSDKYEKWKDDMIKYFED